MQVRNILVPTDFSSHAAAAVERAAELARRLRAKLHLLHACDLGIRVAVPLPEGFIDELRAGAQVRLEDLQKRLAQRGVICEAHVSGLPAVAAVLDCAERISADLIAMGTHGRSDLQQVVLGSVAARVVRVAPCPVLTLRAPGAGLAGGARLLVPTDFSPLGLRAVDCATDLGQALGAPHVILLHACALPPSLGGTAQAYGREWFDAVRERARVELDVSAKALSSAGVSSECITRIGSPAEVIVAAATEHACDYIVMGTHGRSGLPHVLLGSAAERVMRLAPCPVITVREPR